MRKIASLPAGQGFGLAVSPALNLIVTSDAVHNTLTFFRAVAPFSQIGTPWGGHGSGPLQFRLDNPGGHGWGGHMCFTVPVAFSALPSLLVADVGNDRVVEVDVSAVSSQGPSGRPVAVPRTLGEGTGRRPRAVAACAAFIAVSAFTLEAAGNHVVTLYSAATFALVRRFGVGSGVGSGQGMFSQPRGLRFSGSHLLVRAHVGELQTTPPLPEAQAPPKFHTSFPSANVFVFLLGLLP